MNSQLPTESKFLVTGGAGFIGSNFVRKIVSLGYKVNVLDKLTYAGNLENIRSFSESGQIVFFQGDICDPLITSEALDGVDVVVNFAAESHVDRSIENSLYKFPPMKYMDLLKLDLGLKILKYLPTLLILHQKQPETYLLLHILERMVLM